MTVTPQDAAPSPARRLLGRLLALLGLGLAVVAVVLSAQNLYFHSVTSAVSGEVVQVQPVPGTSQQPGRASTWLVTIEYPDSNGQYRRVDQTWSSEPTPAKGADVRIWYRTDRPAEARVADLMQIWWDAVLAAAGALIIGLIAEELLRTRPGPPEQSLSGQNQ